MDDGVSVSTSAVGVSLFASTNIDDIVLLSAFFADRHLAARSVVLGQFVGIGAPTAPSAAAAMASLAVPEGWTALLGHVTGDLELRMDSVGSAAYAGMLS